jgi:hypothetical protein
MALGGGRGCKPAREHCTVVYVTNVWRDLPGMAELAANRNDLAAVHPSPQLWDDRLGLIYLCLQVRYRACDGVTARSRQWTGALVSYLLCFSVNSVLTHICLSKITART